MRRFETVDDLREWLEPMGYETFWRAVIALGLFNEADRAHCDRTIADGIADYTKVLTVMKGFARYHAAEDWGLRFRGEEADANTLTVVH